MHEMSLALEIGRIAELQAGASVRKVITVGVDVGDEAGVEPVSKRSSRRPRSARSP